MAPSEAICITSWRPLADRGVAGFGPRLSPALFAFGASSAQTPRPGVALTVVDRPGRTRTGHGGLNLAINTRRGAPV